MSSREGMARLTAKRDEEPTSGDIVQRGWKGAEAWREATPRRLMTPGERDCRHARRRASAALRCMLLMTDGRCISGFTIRSRERVGG